MHSALNLWWRISVNLVWCNSPSGNQKYEDSYRFEEGAPPKPRDSQWVEPVAPPHQRIESVGYCKMPHFSRISQIADFGGVKRRPPPKANCPNRQITQVFVQTPAEYKVVQWPSSLYNTFVHSAGMLWAPHSMRHFSAPSQPFSTHSQPNTGLTCEYTFTGDYREHWCTFVEDCWKGILVGTS